MATEGSKCCVCGTATTKSCGPCARNGIYLFFCSPEHQKFVWRHHKQVCGAKAHPIRHPFLSQEEVEHLIAHANVPLDHPLTLSSSMDSRTNDEDFASYVRSMRQGRPDLPPDEQQHVLFTLRGSLQMAKESLNGLMELPWLKQSFWIHVVRFDSIAVQHVLRHDARRMQRMPDSLNWSTSRHHGVVFLSLVTRRAEQGQDSVPDDLFYKACDRYIETIVAQRAFRDYEDADKLVADLHAELRVVLKVEFSIMYSIAPGEGDFGWSVWKHHKQVCGPKAHPILARADGLRPPCKLDDGSLKWSTVRHHSIIFLSLMSTRAEAGADIVPDELLYRSCDSYLDAVTVYRTLRDDHDAQKLIADLSAEVRVVLKMKFIAMDFFSGTSTEKRSFIRCFPASQ
ncbi:hypothetical protein JCM10296v2_003464 [Rhodotorula toruloides]